MNRKPWILNYDAHVPTSLTYPQISIIDLFKESIKKFPNNICLIYEDFEFSYSEVDILSDHVAAGLIQLGVKPGERVSIALPNIPQFVFAFLGILKAGAIVVAINPNYRPREIAEMINSSQAETIFYLIEKENEIIKVKQESCLKKSIKCKTGDLKWLKEVKSLKKKYKKPENEDQFNFIDLFQTEINEKFFPSTSPDDPAVFQFTGGTTGTPKAAIGLHRNLVANTRQFINWCDLKPGEETVMAVIPLYHVYGIVLALCLGIALGAKIILISNPKEIEKILGSIEKYLVTFFPGVPSLYYAINQNPEFLLKKYDLHSIKACISGSAPLHPEIKKTFELVAGGKLMEGYGLSEAPTATHCNPLYGENRTGSIGLPLPNMECLVVDIEDNEKQMGINEIGELLIKGPQVMQGYYQDSLETAQVLKNGWLHTGDIVRMDKDGYFYVVDRKKSLIKVGGFQVWPNEIERVLSSHPAVKEAGVGGVPDREHGEKAIAWVVLKPGQKMDTKALQEWCRASLSAFKIPSEIYFVEEIPKTSVGKILRRELLRQYLENKK
jgi:long-chain acyl-CoA synthetase